jgi:hypothetical protein
MPPGEARSGREADRAANGGWHGENPLDDDNEYDAEVRDVLARCVTRRKTTLDVAIDASLTATANLWLSDWLDDAVAAACGGHLDTWQESFGDATYVRLYPGGREEKISGPFPTVPRR